ncbi:MAG: acetate--CoA ligase [Alcanivorax sp.]|nr:acetate--CoA ligase [Alcanivorax sp.]
MDYSLIRKGRQATVVNANLDNYEQVCRDFSWQQVAQAVPGFVDGGLNMGFEAVDRHLNTPVADQMAIRFLPREGGSPVQEISYRELARLSNRFANVLARHGVLPGERVFCLSHRCPALYQAALGTLKHGGVFSPLFAAFGPEPIRSRMAIGQPAVVVTSTRLYRKKLASWIHQLPSLKCILLIDEEQPLPAGTLSLAQQMAQASSVYQVRATRPGDPALLHFTSGTTGRPKGAIHVHEAVRFHYLSAFYALDLHGDDIYWCTADPGWVTGTSYGIIAPLALGVTMVVDEAEFDAERWYRTLQDQKVTVWYTAPTAIRMLMKYGQQLAGQYDLSGLRFLASVGEPLNPEAVIWGRDTLGLPFHDNWWQTETGGIMVANYASMDIKPGSMGRPLPGIEAAIAARTEQGMVLIDDPEETGELVLKAGWPSMFRGYLNEDARYQQCFVDHWYFTGDLARRDADGYFWFVGRADDVIKSAGHLVGPFEVESALMEHPAVAEAGVIGVPDEVSGESIKAFVALRPGYQDGDALYREILGLARKRLGPAVAPKTLAFCASLPKTRSGKIMRRLLKARELGLPEGDTSTLEGNAND